MSLDSSTPSFFLLESQCPVGWSNVNIEQESQHEYDMYEDGGSLNDSDEGMFI